MNVTAYVEMNAFGIIILSFFWHNQKRSGSLSFDDKLFNGILVVTMAEQLMDACQWLLDGANFTGVYQLQMLSYSLGHGIAPIITLLWVMYCDIRVNMDERGIRKRMPLYCLPFLINTLFLIANLFVPLVFRIDSAHIYHRERFFWIYVAIMCLYGLISLLLLGRKALQPRPSPERTEFRIMALFLLPPFIGGILQGMFYGLSLVWFAMVLSIIMIYTKVLNRQIIIDPLTGLNNRRKLVQFLSMKMNAMETEKPLFLMMMDADDFKSINDDFGHTAGDRALVSLAEILKKVSVNRDIFLARLGGDEFLVIGHDRDGIDPKVLAGEIDKEISLFNASTREPFRISLSIGWAYFQPQEMKTIDSLLNAADQSMYRAKSVKKTRSRLH